MNCLDYQDFLQRFLDGAEAAVPPDVDRHLGACPACRELHGAAVRFHEALPLLRLTTPPTGLSDRVVGRVFAERARARRLRRQLVPALAAAVVLAVVGLAGLRRPSESPPEPQRQVAVVERDRGPSLQARVEEVGNAVVGLTRRAAAETVDESRWLVPVLLPDTSAASDFPPTVQPLRAPTESLDEVARSVSAGFEPLTSSARRAVDLFLREITPVAADVSGL